MVASAPRLELEQAGLRLAVATLVLFVLTWRLAGLHDPMLLSMVWTLARFVTFAVAITLWTLSPPHESRSRRVVGMVADNAVTTYFMLVTGENGVLALGIFIFIAFGNGFRYGFPYLQLSQGIALFGFS